MLRNTRNSWLPTTLTVARWSQELTWLLSLSFGGFLNSVLPQKTYLTWSPLLRESKLSCSPHLLKGAQDLAQPHFCTPTSPSSQLLISFFLPGPVVIKVRFVGRSMHAHTARLGVAYLKASSFFFCSSSSALPKAGGGEGNQGLHGLC